MQGQYFGLIGMTEMLIKHGDDSRLPQVQQWLQQADSLIGETLSKEMVGRHYYRKAFVEYRLGNMAEASALFQQSLQVHDHPDNPSRDLLQQGGWQQQQSAQPTQPVQRVQ